MKQPKATSPSVLWAGERQEAVAPLVQIPLRPAAQPSPQRLGRGTGEPRESGEAHVSHTKELVYVSRNVGVGIRVFGNRVVQRTERENKSQILILSE